ncbi:enoyl-CoA hydratase-related protein [Castellaniella sp.]|uniref:enoyl-CoA hydratase-related protein n=1 Tax=Castellaniella sp. TaxID=1955812 RepID=UPI003562B899
MGYETIAVDVDARGVASLVLCRPDVHNAMDGRMWAEGLEATQRLAEDASVRAVVLTGSGKSFCSGGDLKFQLAQRKASTAEKIAHADTFMRWLQALDTLPKPVIARIQGPAYAGGLGLISVCDLAIGVDTLTFAITEARLGLQPAMISPFVVRRLGVAKARRFFLTGQRFNAAEALAMGFLDRVESAGTLDAAVEEEIELVLQCAPGAVGKVKHLIAQVAHLGLEGSLAYSTDQAVQMWDSEEAVEGISSFLEKRRPAWIASSDRRHRGQTHGK